MTEIDYIELFFYNGLRYGDLRNKFIAIMSGGIFTHVELKVNGVRFTSEPGKGCIAIINHDGTNDPEPIKHWRRILIPAHQEQCEALSSYMLAHTANNTEYDWRGVFGTLFPFLKQDKSKLFCSEFALLGLKYVGIYYGPTVISPNRMYKILKELSVI